VAVEDRLVHRLQFFITLSGVSTTDLEQLRARLATVTLTDVPVIVANRHGLILYVDPPIAHVLEWHVDELVGRPLTAIIPRRFHDAHHLGFSRFLATGQRVLMERKLGLWAVTRTGTELHVEHVITAIQSEAGWLFAAAIRVNGAGDA
jgi:PAS domain S-box-containing protein